jgi:hypothetical protein
MSWTLSRNLGTILNADAAPYSAEGNPIQIEMCVDQEQDGKTFPIETGTRCGPGDVKGTIMAGLIVFKP